MHYGCIYAIILITSSLEREFILIKGGSFSCSLFTSPSYHLFYSLFVVPFLYKYVKRIHTGWFVLILPILLFTYFIQMLHITSNGRTLFSQAEWIPSLGMNFTVYVDGLSLLFALLITGIGSLVVLYSIFYLSKEKNSLALSTRICSCL